MSSFKDNGSNYRQNLLLYWEEIYLGTYIVKNNVLFLCDIFLKCAPKVPVPTREASSQSESVQRENRGVQSDGTFTVSISMIYLPQRAL